jgi:hypothetical protein
VAESKLLVEFGMLFLIVIAVKTKAPDRPLETVRSQSRD